MIQIHDKAFVPLINEGEILKAIVEIAKKINADYTNKKPLFIGVLNGSFMFAAALFKEITIEAEISFIRVQSYQNMESTGVGNQILGLVENIENRDIIVIEDIVDTGLTIKSLLENLYAKKPNSIKIATLLFKPKALKTNVLPDYIGFEIMPDFVVGYGLDYNGLGRNLNGIYVLKN